MNNQNRHLHIAPDQPLVHLFSVPMTEVERRVSSGSKWADKPKHKSELNARKDGAR
jgi:hypothetical protein